MKYLSICDGIGAAHIWKERLGWTCVGASEIEPFPIAVVKSNHPEIPHLGDMTKYHEWKIERPDLVCGGTPCQSFSVAGLRAGLADPRGNLALVFLGIVDHFRPRWVVWENVPGVFSCTSHEAADLYPPDVPLDVVAEQDGVDTDSYDADEDHAFNCFVAGLEELGYGVFYRVLDAQYFGVPQRRRRPFVVGYLGDWRPPTAVLLEPESMSGNPPPSRRKGQRPTGTLEARTAGGGGLGTDFDLSGGLVEAAAGPDVAAALGAQPNASHRPDSDTYVAHSLRGEGFDASEDGTGRGTPLVPTLAPTLEAQGVTTGQFLSGGAIPVLLRMREGKEGGGKGPLVSSDQSLTLATGNDQVLAHFLHMNKGRPDGRKSKHDEMVTVKNHVPTLTTDGHQGSAVASGMQVRRLTPRECERLQSFPDDYTLIPWRGKPASECPDGPRYKALGNSWCRNVVLWIGRRIQLVEEIKSSLP